jgi:hypothetical protein
MDLEYIDISPDFTLIKHVYITINLFNLCQQSFLPFYIYFLKCWHRLNEPLLLGVLMAISPTDIRILFTNYDIITYLLNLAFCSEHFISINPRYKTSNIGNF